MSGNASFLRRTGASVCACLSAGEMYLPVADADKPFFAVSDASADLLLLDFDAPAPPSGADTFFHAPVMTWKGNKEKLSMRV